MMPKPCSERDRLREVHYQATLEASALSGTLPSAPFGWEFSAALDKAKAASLACNVARRAYEKHCEQHGCEVEFHGPLALAMSSGNSIVPGSRVHFNRAKSRSLTICPAIA
jgi:hypothetical protein